jgi:hypothetical protein
MLLYFDGASLAPSIGKTNGVRLPTMHFIATIVGQRQAHRTSADLIATCYKACKILGLVF